MRGYDIKQNTIRVCVAVVLDTHGHIHTVDPPRTHRAEISAAGLLLSVRSNDIAGHCVALWEICVKRYPICKQD